VHTTICYTRRHAPLYSQRATKRDALEAAVRPQPKESISVPEINSAGRGD
jgi:hypothetical protein